MAKKTPKKDGKDRLFVDVVETAVEFHKRRLWHHVDSADPISIRVEGEEHPLVCFVLGHGGVELGVSALRGEHAMEGFEEVILTGGRLASDAPCDLLLLSFEIPTEVDPDFLRPLHQSGRVFGKNSAAPIFVGKCVGEPSRPMTRPELRIMQTILRTLLMAASSGQLQQREWDWKRRTLELTLEGKGKKAHVLDSVRTWPPPRREEEREVRTPVLTQA
ncbi:hypothetical protein Poly30_10710 [Planctomycetes bacterium Poly30]|uniref:DUF7309 domain-containing protein n=1 Tax=Saltatorellus ferox TaxID=2528018 RepID=A0A518ENB2_9BACT|nr:hypothetical protein Poly30_10710 [Planctomycetes bacterium Poly30]